jgi:hypothetical protein
MKILIFAIFTIGSSFFLTMAQSELKVESGRTYTVTQKDKKMLVNKWVMEDNSTIIISDDVSVWEIHAIEASFGKNCKIVGNRVGKQSRNGANSTKHGSKGGSCTPGGKGGQGDEGAPGPEGSSVKITMGLIYVNDLLIDVRGGVGGNGGKGANGGKGGDASCSSCSGQDGGQGGKGGLSGRGGHGGNVYVGYWIAGTSNIASINNGLRALTTRGRSGTGGTPGNPGPGGDATECGLFKRSGGNPGPKGVKGGYGKYAKDGEVIFEVIPSPK